MTSVDAYVMEAELRSLSVGVPVRDELPEDFADLTQREERVYRQRVLDMSLSAFMHLVLSALHAVEDLQRRLTLQSALAAQLHIHQAESMAYARLVFEVTMRIYHQSSETRFVCVLPPEPKKKRWTKLRWTQTNGVFDVHTIDGKPSEASDSTVREKAISMDKITAPTVAVATSGAPQRSYKALQVLLSVTLHRSALLPDAALHDGLSPACTALRFLRCDQLRHSSGLVLPIDPSKDFAVEGHVVSASRNSSNFFSAILISMEMEFPDLFWMTDVCGHFVETYLKKDAAGQPDNPYQDPENGSVVVAMFQLKDVFGDVFDAASHVKGITATNFAAKCREVVICGAVELAKCRKLRVSVTDQDAMRALSFP